MCEKVLTTQQRRWMGNWLGLDDEEAPRTLAFWSAAHDLGKASPAFQRQYSPIVPQLEEAGLTFPRLFIKEPCMHGTISAHVLGPLLTEMAGLDARFARRLAYAVGGHHGSWPLPAEVQALKASQLGEAGWTDVRRRLVGALIETYRPATPTLRNGPRGADNAALTFLSGLVSVADWIGSSEAFFPFEAEAVDPAAYGSRAALQAEQALAELGWTAHHPPAAGAAFEELFPFHPNPVQQAAVQIADGLDQPSLIIIETPTGSGKTEAALYLADRFGNALQQRGFYVAMPTMATSNQMHRRVGEMLGRRYPGRGLTPLLVHSQARWLKHAVPPAIAMGDDGPSQSGEAMAWFLPRKRSLLAPFGVGTVDQALLSVLQTRHFFVRLFGLSHKTVIFDEVHAYDTYMSRLFDRLLAWLRAVGASVVILSATLPERARVSLLEAYAGSDLKDAHSASYPSLTWACAGGGGAVSVVSGPPRELTIESIGHSPQAIVAFVAGALREGGCAAVICNRVARAQEVHRELQSAKLVPPEDLILFHARFPFAWRDEIETSVLSRFGKNGDRRSAIVVATQVIEQSLDLDFDVMVSDLAPIDFLLQRAGRLHRHPTHSRPPALASARLAIPWPNLVDGVPDFGLDRFVYEPYILLRSYLALTSLTRITLPADTTRLIEAVYGDADEPSGEASPAISAPLEAARRQLQVHEEKDVAEALQRLVPQPNDERLLQQRSTGLREDSPELHTAFQALTRLGPPSLSLVCLHRVAGGLRTEPDGGGALIDIDRPPDSDTTLNLARATLQVSHRQVVAHFRDEAVPAAWSEHPLLRDHRLAVFSDGICRLEGGGLRLRLSREVGLEIEKEVQ
jgi:CRISPR-associated endonuclease/helicase Cas3